MPRLGDRIGRLILAVARDLIRGSVSRSQALDIIEDLRLHDSRRPQPGGNQRDHSGGPHPGRGRVTIGPEQGAGRIGVGPSDQTPAPGGRPPRVTGPALVPTGAPSRTSPPLAASRRKMIPTWRRRSSWRGLRRTTVGRSRA